MNRHASLLVFVFLFFTVTDAHARTWTDASGKFSFEADLVSVERDSVRLWIAERGAEYVVPMRLLSESDQAFVRQQANAPQGPGRAGNTVPSAILAKIKRNAANEWRDNYSMQKFQIEQQTKAYLYLKTHSDSRIPDDVLATIKRNAADEWRDNYSMQQFQIEQETKAYRALHGGP